MNKGKLLEIVEKYYLGGLTEQVRLKIKDNKLTINFATNLKDCIGELKTEFELEDNELGIYDSTQFYKLIKVLTDPINIEVVKSSDKALSLNITDETFNLIYNLGDLGLISEGKLSNELPDPLIKVELNDEFVNKFIKAHNALEKAETFKLTTKNTKKNPNSIQITIGLNEKFSNKISFIEPCEEFAEISNYIYQVSNFREILNINKMSKITMFVYSMGIIKIETFNETTGINMIYYLVPNKN